MSENEDNSRQTLSLEGTPWSVAAILIAASVAAMVICGFASWIVVEMIRSN